MKVRIVSKFCHGARRDEFILSKSLQRLSTSLLMLEVSDNSNRNYKIFVMVALMQCWDWLSLDNKIINHKVTFNAFGHCET